MHLIARGIPKYRFKPILHYALDLRFGSLKRSKRENQSNELAFFDTNMLVSKNGEPIARKLPDASPTREVFLYYTTFWGKTPEKIKNGSENARKKRE